MTRLLCTAVLSALCACSTGRPPIQYYTLSLELPEGNAAPAGSLSLSRFWARDPYGQGRMVYRPSPYRLDFYNYHLWAAPPPEQVQDWTARYLRARRLFTRVSSSPEAGGDLELGAMVRRFEEIDGQDRWEAALAVDFWLQKRGERTPSWSGAYEQSCPAPRRNPQAIAEAMSRCLEQVLARLSADLGQVGR